MKIAAAEHQVLLAPNHLGPKGESTPLEGGGDSVGMEAAMPRIDHVSRGERKRVAACALSVIVSEARFRVSGRRLPRP